MPVRNRCAHGSPHAKTLKPLSDVSLTVLHVLPWYPDTDRHWVPFSNVGDGSPTGVEEGIDDMFHVGERWKIFPGVTSYGFQTSVPPLFSWRISWVAPGKQSIVLGGKH